MGLSSEITIFDTIPDTEKDVQNKKKQSSQEIDKYINDYSYSVL